MAFFASVRANKNALAGGASIVGAGVGLVSTVRLLLALSPGFVNNECALRIVYNHEEFNGCVGHTPGVQRVMLAVLCCKGHGWVRRVGHW